MKRNIDFYRRTVTQHNDWEFKLLRRHYQWAGEGKFWALVDIMGAEDGCELDLNDEDKQLSHATDLDFDAEEFMQFLSFLEKKPKLVTQVRPGVYTTRFVSEVFEEVESVRKTKREWKQQQKEKKMGGSEGMEKTTLSPSTGDQNEKVDGENGKKAGETAQSRGEESISEKSIVKKNEIQPPAGGNGAAAPASPPDELKDFYEKMVKNKRSLCDFIKQKPQFIEPYAELWKIFATEKKLATVKELTKSRRQKFATRIKEKGFDFWAILKRAGESQFIQKSKWFSFDWVLENDKNYLKVLEGNYDDATIAAMAPSDDKKKKAAQLLIDIEFMVAMFHEGNEISHLITWDMYVYLEENKLVSQGYVSKFEGDIDSRTKLAVKEWIKKQAPKTPAS